MKKIGNNNPRKQQLAISKKKVKEATPVEQFDNIFKEVKKQIDSRDYKSLMPKGSLPQAFEELKKCKSMEKMHKKFSEVMAYMDAARSRLLEADIIEQKSFNLAEVYFAFAIRDSFIAETNCQIGYMANMLAIKIADNYLMYVSPELTKEDISTRVSLAQKLIKITTETFNGRYGIIYYDIKPEVILHLKEKEMVDLLNDLHAIYLGIGHWKAGMQQFIKFSHMKGDLASAEANQKSLSSYITSKSNRHRLEKVISTLDSVKVGLSKKNIQQSEWESEILNHIVLIKNSINEILESLAFHNPINAKTLALPSGTESELQLQELLSLTKAAEEILFSPSFIPLTKLECFIKICPKIISETDENKCSKESFFILAKAARIYLYKCSAEAQLESKMGLYLDSIANKLSLKFVDETANFLKKCNEKIISFRENPRLHALNWTFDEAPKSALHMNNLTVSMFANLLYQHIADFTPSHVDIVLQCLDRILEEYQKRTDVSYLLTGDIQHLALTLLQQCAVTQELLKDFNQNQTIINIQSKISQCFPNKCGSEIHVNLSIEKLLSSEKYQIFNDEADKIIKENKKKREEIKQKKITEPKDIKFEPEKKSPIELENKTETKEEKLPTIQYPEIDEKMKYLSSDIPDREFSRLCQEIQTLINAQLSQIKRFKIYFRNQESPAAEFQKYFLNWYRCCLEIKKCEYETTIFTKNFNNNLQNIAEQNANQYEEQRNKLKAICVDAMQLQKKLATARAEVKHIKTEMETLKNKSALLKENVELFMTVVDSPLENGKETRTRLQAALQIAPLSGLKDAIDITASEDKTAYPDMEKVQILERAQNALDKNSYIPQALKENLYKSFLEKTGNLVKQTQKPERPSHRLGITAASSESVNNAESPNTFFHFEINPELVRKIRVDLFTPDRKHNLVPIARDLRATRFEIIRHLANRKWNTAENIKLLGLQLFLESYLCNSYVKKMKTAKIIAKLKNGNAHVFQSLSEAERTHIDELLDYANDCVMVVKGNASGLCNKMANIAGNGLTRYQRHVYFDAISYLAFHKNRKDWSVINKHIKFIKNNSGKIFGGFDDLMRFEQVQTLSFAYQMLADILDYVLIPFEQIGDESLKLNDVKKLYKHVDSLYHYLTNFAEQCRFETAIPFEPQVILSETFVPNVLRWYVFCRMDQFRLSLEQSCARLENLEEGNTIYLKTAFN